MRYDLLGSEGFCFVSFWFVFLAHFSHLPGEEAIWLWSPVPEIY